MCVSVLFSEPKIPQLRLAAWLYRQRGSFSALQRAENSSIQDQAPNVESSALVFQCSSASRKFLNRDRQQPPRALSPAFQCSSASRKFLNAGVGGPRVAVEGVSVLFSEPKIPQYRRETAMTVNVAGFSALQRAENSSIRTSARKASVTRSVSVLFSEPKIPQCGNLPARCSGRDVSVLFSEPKIPQSL